MRRRGPDQHLIRVLVVLLAAVALGGAGLGAAAAEDPLPPPLTPPGVTPPPVTGENQVPPGPTYVVTPGPEGAELGPPADQREIDEVTGVVPAPAGPTAAPAGTSKAPRSTVAPPQEAVPAAAAARAPDPVPLDSRWVIGAGILLALVLLELLRAATARPVHRGLRLPA